MDGARGPIEATRRPRGRAVFAILCVTIIWGWTFVWMKQATEAGDAWLREVAPLSAPGGPHAASGALSVITTFLVLRFALAALLLALCSRRARQGLDRASWGGGLLLGSLLLGGFLLQMYGLQSVSASVSAFLTSLYVVFTAAILAAIARRMPGLPLVLGALLATFGAAYIDGPPEVSFGWGEWLTIASALVFAFHIVWTDRVTRRLEPMAITLTSFVVVGAGASVVAALTFGAGQGPPWSALGALLRDPDFSVPLACSAVLATLIAITLMNLYQRELNPLRAAILYALEPVWAAMIAVGGGTEEPTRWLYLGGGALLAGNLVAEWRRPASGTG
jgi:drug/metabolite transporter (DMT)-like permease